MVSSLDLKEITEIDKQESQEKGTAVSIIVPAYNEELTIAQELETIKKAMDDSGLPYEIIVVDDGSSDATAKIVAGYPWVRYVRHETNKGSGSARKTGTLLARGEFVVWTDADCTYPNHLIPALIHELADCDQVIGARTSEQGTQKILRMPAKYFIRKLACYLAEADIPDLNSGLRAFRRDVAMKYLHLLPRGFSCVSTITLSFICNGYRVKYMPIEYYKRVGKSKFHPVKDAYNYLVQVVRMVTYFNPLRVLLPLALFLLVVGVGKTIHDVVRYNFHIAGSTLMVMLTAIQIGVMALLADLIVKRSR